MPPKGRNIIVLGTSAGGLEALDQLVGQLPTDLPASLFIVQHMAAHNSGEPLLRRLNRHKAFHRSWLKMRTALSQGASISLRLTIISWSRKTRCS
jgi:chemotaxis response regulator CheB